MFDANGNPSGATNMGTVSPTDLLIGASAPNSTALTNLTSPSLFGGSPLDGFETSPAFESAGDFGNGQEWFPPLFPSDESAALDPSGASEEQSQFSGPDGSSTTPAVSSNVKDGLKSPTSGRRKSGSPRHSAVSGVNARRRDKPLPPIIVDDPTDVVAMKRARNTLAARKSRQRKAERLDELEKQIEELRAERDHYKALAENAGAI